MCYLSGQCGQDNSIEVELYRVHGCRGQVRHCPFPNLHQIIKNSVVNPDLVGFGIISFRYGSRNNERADKFKASHPKFSEILALIYIV